MNCPKCDDLFRLVAMEDDVLNSGLWYGRYECKVCKIYVEAIGTDLDNLFEKLDVAAQGEWKPMKTIMTRIGNRIREIPI